MSSLVQSAYQANLGSARGEVAPRSARAARKGVDSAKGLSAMLLAAVVAALLVVANQMVDNWSEGNLLAAWVVMWAVGFAALGLCAGTARKLALRLVAALDAWSQRVASRRADERFLAAATEDPRVMADLQRALDQGEPALAARARATLARYEGWYSHYLREGRGGSTHAPVRSTGEWLAQYEPAFDLKKASQAAGSEAPRDTDSQASSRAVAARYAAWLSQYMKANRVEEYPTQPRAGGLWQQQF